MPVPRRRRTLGAHAGLAAPPRWRAPRGPGPTPRAMLACRLAPAAPLAAVALLAACGAQLTTAPEGAAPARSRDAAPAADAGTTAGAADAAGVTLRDAAGAAVGTARLSADARGRVHLVVRLRGVTPGRHGLHLHAVGACEAPGAGPAFASAGGHYNPAAREHGHRNPLGHHAGDLPNVEVGPSGNGHLAVRLEQFALAALADTDGTALVLHQHEDDGRTNAGPLGPGNSGPRVACGVVAPR